ncbi:MAG: hypothetical protein LUH45_00570, partial [Clostridiales bacterium]|nr:hypothetical protein [Clostridiales bacterium]
NLFICCSPPSAFNERFYIVISLPQIPLYIKQCFPGLAAGRYLGFQAGISGKKLAFLCKWKLHQSDALVQFHYFR